MFTIAGSSKIAADALLALWASEWKGATVPVRVGDVTPTSGIVVGVRGHEKRLSFGEDTLAAVTEYVEGKRDVLAGEGHYLGLWCPDEDTLVLDVVEVFQDVNYGIYQGNVRGEDAVFNLGTGEEYNYYRCQHCGIVGGH